MADSSDSDAEVTFESADEGEQDETVEKKDDNDASKPVPSKSQDNESVASATQKSTESEHADSFRTEVNVDESRTKGEESMEEPDMSKQKNGNDGKGMEHDVNKTESRTDLSDETGGGDAKESVKTDDGNETEGTPGKEKEQKEPEGEEIVNRGASSGQEDTEADAKAGKAPENASSASGGGWGWGGWGTSLLSSAAATVTKVSDNVGKGLTQVLENVETSLGVPKPEELGEIEKEEAKKMAREKEEQSAKPDEGDQEIKEGECSEDKSEGQEEEVKEKEGAGIGSFFSSGASVLTSAMGKTVSGGLDALEMIGRKTMDILQEGDPRLEKKRGMIIPKREKSNLSEVLRQAKKDAEEEAARRQEEEEHQKYNYSFLFDQYQGLAHLEALEMLSNQSETKVQSSISIVTDDRLDDLKTELLEVRDAFQLEDLDAVDEETASDQDFVNVITELLFSLSMAATPDKLQRVQKETRDWLATHTSQQNEEDDKENTIDIKDIHAKAMQTLAELTARTIEQFHKVSELMLLGQETEQAKAKSPVERATTLSKLASILSAEVSSVATKFCELLSSLGDQGSEEVNTIITNIYLEASNSTSYIQDAFQLLLPILQDIVVMTKNSEDETS
ncbi:protein FAM114A2-like [Lytechinus variegatus]|uniref:protein FAM114A2-like n=1 Tax=Lytechinus variegatus TaxID=7654 RepID=UPI001BB1C9CA|nr:protein FAM114A2-like [Lytechinus variegatus]XP_041455038.1 protein FAM114A2-like [Lytechinus variegatus]